MPPGAIVRERARNGRVRDSRGLRATRSDRGGGEENPGDENARNSRTNRHEKTEERPRPRSPRRGSSNARSIEFPKLAHSFYRWESRFFPRLFFFETVHACESASREGKEVVAFSFFGATRAPRVHNSHGHQHRRLSPTLHQQPCVKSSPSTSARPVSRPVTRAGSCTASSTVSSLSTSDAGAAPFSGSFELPVRARNCRDLRGRRDANRATRDARECSSVREQSRGYSPRRFRARDRRATSTACCAVRATVRPRGGFSSRLTVASRMRADRISAPL